MKPTKSIIPDLFRITSILLVTGLFFSTRGFAQCGVVINTYPYAEDFENNDGSWVSGGTGNDWAWGSPSKPVITAAGSGLKCWIVGGLSMSSYASGERSFVLSPCFDFTNIVTPQISFKIFWETEKQYDGTNFQYSTDGGNTWTNVGAYGDPVDCRNNNWFNYGAVTNLSMLANVKEGWSGNIQTTSGSCQGGLGSNGWVDASHMMPYLGGKPQVIFRFTFGSGTTCNSYDGFAFDKIQIDEALPLPALSYQTVQASCNQPDGEATITVTGGTGPFNYTWSPNVSSSFQATGLLAGTYIVTVSEPGGCTVSVQLVIPQSPDITLSLKALSDTCNTGKGSISSFAGAGTPPFQYLWNTGNITGNLSTINANTYTLTVTDGAGCTSVQTISVNDTGYFTIDLGPDMTICGPANILLSPGSYDHYTWQDGSTVDVYAINKPGLYSVEVAKSNGCSSTDSIKVTENCLEDILMPGAFSPNEDSYNDILLGVGSDITSFDLRIFNRWGILVFQSSDPQKGWDGKFRGIPSPEGIYAWKIVFTIAASDSKEKIGTVFLIR